MPRTSRAKRSKADESPTASTGQNASQPAAARPKPAARPRRSKLPETLPAFWTLPHELQHRILSLACTGGALPRSYIAGRSDECTETMLRLSLSCRALYPLATSLLYAHVRLTRPSDLRLFQQTLASRPALGLLVKSLHIGPEQAQADEWWPKEDFGSLGLSIDLFRLDMVDEVDDARCPWWATATQCIALEDWNELAFTPPVLQAINNALEDASRDLGVNVRDLQQESDHSGGNIGSDTWHIRVLELQAAMELYCLDMQRRDELEKLRTGADSWEDLQTSYARLVIGSKSPASSISKDEDGRGICRISRHQLYQRITRRGATTDNFNHPLLFARSGLKWVAEDADDIEHEGQAPRQGLDEEEDFVRCFAWPRTQPSTGASLNRAEDLAEAIDLAIPGTATVGGNVSLARLVLGLTPQIGRLSLTGFLECALLGESAPSTFPALRSVTLGPPPLGWQLAHQSPPPALRDVARLRICGRVPNSREIADIVGDDAFAKLRELQWSMSRKVTYEDRESLLPALKQLIGVDANHASATDAGEAPEQGLKRSRAAYEADPSQDLQGSASQDRAASPGGPSQVARGQQSKVLLIKARLHPRDAINVIKSAPSKLVAKAWLSGNAVPGQQHRLQLDEFPTKNSIGHSAKINKKMKPLFEEGRKFWEEDM